MKLNLEEMTLLQRIATAITVLVLVIIFLVLLWAASLLVDGAKAQDRQRPGTIVLNKLTGPDQQVIYVNPQQIVSLRTPRGPEVAGPQTKCIIHTTDGKFISIAEPCDSFVHVVEPIIPPDASPAPQGGIR